jgi:hypothetical protein
MSAKRHDERPTKWCRDCETHFRARPEVHSEVYHSGGDFDFLEGDWKDARRRDRFQVK